MINFEYENKTKLIFGKGKHKEIGALIKPYSNKILLHYGGGSIKKSGVYD
ncbi:MAG TPA: NADH-dependent alcohol dehydrogenase, partial [Clostridium sp.]